MPLIVPSDNSRHAADNAHMQRQESILAVLFLAAQARADWTAPAWQG
jgi:hypothetical protein